MGTEKKMVISNCLVLGDVLSLEAQELHLEDESGSGRNFGWRSGLPVRILWGKYL